ncbi:MAG: 1,4-alpha-glucan branching protein GlgB [Clostridiales bacterium]|nr:1,4-alpha-glucan branching protein GlgB [Clostridiales bacterium]
MKNKNDQLYLFHQGTYYQAYEFLGAHPHTEGDQTGYIFRTWAPNASKVSVLGDFNGWNNTAHVCNKINKDGIWEVFVPNAKPMDNYKFEICDKKGFARLKADPYAFLNETNGNTASKVFDIEGYDWHDQGYMEYRRSKNHYTSPMNIYEVNLGSWKKNIDDCSYYTYHQLADELVPYVVNMGYTHIELMPITEYPFDGSWGYQVTGYFSPTSRFGTPHDFMYFVDKCHESGLGVILDWVPAHFPKDAHGLIEFDGTCLYENQGWDRKEHKSWGTRRFDYGRGEVQSFLISSAMLFVDKYHIDGLRVDAVASMLYLDYDKRDGEWIPNEYGDNKNIEAVAFLQKLNSAVLSRHSDIMMIAEESTAWPMVTKPPQMGGLGFNFKWNIGWMNDSLEYIKTDPFFRKSIHNKLTFSMFYAFSENFVLPISHDEVVYGKCSLLNKMFGEYDDKFKSMRAYLSYMMAHPGKKLTFMGTEFAQFKEWDYQAGIDFCLLEYDSHRNMHNFVKALNQFYLTSPELFEEDFSWKGFDWIVPDDNLQNILVMRRMDNKGGELIYAVNFSPVTRENYCFGVDSPDWEEVFTTDNTEWGGSGITNGKLKATKEQFRGKKYKLSMTIPAFSGVFLRKKSKDIRLA